MASSGNFTTWNPLNVGSGGSTSLTVGNTNAVMTGADPRTTGTLGGTISDADGFYFETVATSIGGGALTLGIVNDDRHNQCMKEQIHQRSGSFMWRPYSSGQFFVETSTNTSYGAFANGDILGWFVKDSKLYVKKNDANVVGDVVNVSGGIPITGDFFFPAVSRTVGGGAQTSSILRPDSGSWSYTPPDGFKGLTSKDMNISADIDPAQTDDENPQKQFNAVAYDSTGDGQSITGVGFQPDLVWIKCRSNDQGNGLFDSSRGTSKVLSSDSTAAESTSSGLTSFDSDGYTMGTLFNQSGRQYVSWCWRANGGTTASNTDGATTSTVQANTKAGFSISQFSNASGATTIGHGLGKAPSMYVIKIADGGGGSWGVYHKSLGATKYIRFNSNAGSATASNYFNDTEPTSTVLSVGSTWTGTTIMCYAWAEIEGYSKFGSFEGNSNADGPFIYTGFRPRLVFCKAVDASENWQVRDTARSTFNADSQVRIYWNSDAAEGSASTASPIDFLSNGFKVRGSNSEINTNTIVYGAWGDVPFKYNNTF